MSVNTETGSAQGQTTCLTQESVYASLFDKINLTPASSLGDINAFLDDAALSDIVPLPPAPLHARPWPLKDRWVQEEQQVEWRLVGEA